MVALGSQAVKLLARAAGLCRAAPNLMSASTWSPTRTFARNFGTKRIQASYNVLKVNKNFTPDQIRAKYLRLVKIYHPDNTDTGNTVKFRQIVEAYRRIKEYQNDPEPHNSRDVPDAFDPRFSEDEYRQQMRERMQQEIDFFQKCPMYNRPTPAFSLWSMIKHVFRP